MFLKWFSLILLTTLVLGKIHSKDKATSRRDGKLFSLFSIVQFKNDACVSSSSLATGQSSYRNGTCYTSSECSNKGGSSKGSCAAGFGVCCLFTYKESSNTLSANDSYLQNPDFPSSYNEQSSVTYNIEKISNDICWLRLDFEQFSIAANTGTEEGSATNMGGVCIDSFTVTTSTGQAIPTICGSNNGQHIYVDVGQDNSDKATLTFTFGSPTNTVSRKWDIKASQIQCGKNYAPPEGCLQYQTGLTGRIQTFNFAANDQHLADQFYSSCVRQNKGYCCIQYQLCSDPNSWTLNNVGADKGLVDAACATDYVQIENSNAGCNLGNAGTLISKYCGDFLNSLKEATKGSVPICDCTPPFEVGIRTNSGTADQDANAKMLPNRGVCLEYNQIPCSSFS